LIHSTTASGSRARVGTSRPNIGSARAWLKYDPTTQNQKKNSQISQYKMAKVTTAEAAAAIKQHKGFITQAAKTLGISRRHLHTLINRHPTIKEALDDAREEMKDFAESKIYQGINNDNTALLIFYAKTQMKDRGYIERQEIDHSGAVKIEVIYGDRDGKSETAPPKTD
jgi:hypothetical protein